MLVKPNKEDENAILELLEKWHAFGGRMNPGLLRKCRNNYDEWLKLLYNWENGINIGQEVPQTLYLLKNNGNEILGAVSLRHYLNETNFTDGGHIGYGICPPFRGKGYGNLILSLALEKMREMKIEKVLVTCDKDNIPSQKVILRNNGIFENHAFDEDKVLINRYWIDNKSKNSAP